MRTELAVTVAEERAQNEISEKFNKIKEDILLPFADEYATALDELEEARKKGPDGDQNLPVPPDLKELAQREGLNFEVDQAPVPRRRRTLRHNLECRGRQSRPSLAAASSPKSSSIPRKGSTSRKN